MSVTVKGNHPLAEIIAKKLFGIESVPAEEQRKMVSRACREAVKYHEDQIEEYQDVINNAREEILILLSEKVSLQCCGNCEHSAPYNEDWHPCETCNRSKSGLGYKDNWEKQKKGGVDGEVQS